MSRIKNKRLHNESSLKEQWPMLVMMLPFFTLFFLLTIIPIISSVFLSTTSFDLLNPIKFVGIDNYFRMFVTDDSFLTVLKNTLILVLMTGPGGFLLAFLLAWIVNEFSPTTRTLLSFMFYAPSLCGNAFFIWKIIFSGDSYGYLNSILLSLGVITEPITFLSDAKYLMPIVIIVQLWQSMGISFLSNIAGLQNVSNDLYEAGAIDGLRNRWQELWYITLPSMQHMILFSVVMQIQSSFTVSAITTELAGYPSVGYSVDTIVSLMTDVGTVRYEMGYAAAISCVLFLLMAGTRIILGKFLQIMGK
ncbi:MAG: sugar ABC transporter permease [Clostridia bacterium]|nr:sugar ABC transporter permease [Clostridia bacterium]